MLDVGNGQGDLIELPIGRVWLEVQLHLFAIGNTPGLQTAHAAVELARQHGLLTGCDLEIQFIAVVGFGAEMHLGRGEHRPGPGIVFDVVAAEAVAGNFQSIAGGPWQQGPLLLATFLGRLDQALTYQLPLAVEQVQVLTIGVGLPGWYPAHDHIIRAVGLQVQATVADAGPLHRRALGKKGQAPKAQASSHFPPVLHRPHREQARSHRGSMVLADSAFGTRLLWELACSRRGRHIHLHCKLIRRSHKVTTTPCGSELARDGGLAGNRTHADFPSSILRIGSKSLGRMISVCHSATPLRRQYMASSARVTPR
ncbi:hypothetical protein D3C78_1175860 [compost metagenome]